MMHALLLAVDAPATPSADGPGLAFWLVMLAALSLLPFILTMVTSFAKIVIVGGILRQALGTQHIPPNSVLTGLALILSLLIMSPVAQEMINTWNAVPHSSKADTGQVATELAAAVEPALTRFLNKHSHPENVQLFRGLHERIVAANSAPVPATAPATSTAPATATAPTAPTAPAAPAAPAAASAPAPASAPADAAAPASPGTADTQPAALASFGSDPHAKQLFDDMTVLAPAFILTELTHAFQIGFLIFIPFLVLDLVVSNVLLAMGMHMLSPTTISLPLKLMLFVLVDGWRLLFQGLVLGYT